MEFNEIASVSGKGGLFRILKTTKTGVILEGLDSEKKRIVTGPHHRVSVLSDISIYTTDVEATVQLKDVFHKIHNEFGDDPGVDSKSEKDELYAFIKHVVPDYDPERVYTSDIKKVVSWYRQLLQVAPEVLKEVVEEKETTPTEKPKVKKKAEDQPES